MIKPTVEIASISPINDSQLNTSAPIISKLTIIWDSVDAPYRWFPLA